MLKSNIVSEHVIVVHFYVGITSLLINKWQFPYPYVFFNPVRIYGKKINDMIRYGDNSNSSYGNYPHTVPISESI